MTDPLTRLRAMGVGLEKTDEYGRGSCNDLGEDPAFEQGRSYLRDNYADAMRDELATIAADALEEAEKAEARVRELERERDRMASFVDKASLLAKIRRLRDEVAGCVVASRISEDRYEMFHVHGVMARALLDGLRLADRKAQETTDEH